MTKRVSDTGDGRLGARIVLVHGTVQAPHNKAPGRRRYVLVEFTAVLRDGEHEVARVSGKVTSHDAATERTESVAGAISSAVAALYERVARDLFARRTAARRR